ncbi:response regulator [Aestuariibacter salexigens]|uniref:response regulator n=1 Tax=Aestuariibacter salexigens TaxID=226010 RepID=UPI00047EDA93|nr:response regulator [Aestuariibacter salexigens]
MKILLVDDDPTIVELFEMDLKYHYDDCAVFSASNGVEALEHCSRSAFDLIFTDGKMPKMDGLALAKRLKEINYSAVTILVTGYHELIDDKSYEKFGITKILHKPVKLKEIHECVDFVKDTLNSQK